MEDFVTTVPGLAQVLDRDGIQWRGVGFEILYSSLVSDPQQHDRLRVELEQLVDNYFSSLILPDQPTIYDFLVLSLRDKDVIATFNWDPFLIHAYCRNHGKVPSLPRLLFPHGNVLTGYCAEDRVVGLRGHACGRCGRPLAASKLLYPVANKDYRSDPMISATWDDMLIVMRDAVVVTVFGYSAPASDAGAIDLLASAWGRWEDRQFEEFEIIDIRPKDDLREEWDRFIHTHHYQVVDRFADSWIANHPRRTVETYIRQTMEALFVEDNPLPQSVDLEALWSWFGPISEAERSA